MLPTVRLIRCSYHVSVFYCYLVVGGWLVCTVQVQHHVLLESSCAIVGRYVVECLYEKKDEICIKRQPVVICG